MPQARNANEQLVVDFFETLSSGEIENIRTYIDDDTTWEPVIRDMLGAGVHKGNAICDEFLAPVRGMFQPGEPKVHVDTLVSSDDTVMCETRGVGTLKNGKVYNNRYAWLFRIRNGRIKTVREYFDSNYVLRLLG
jgi:ketosteroid isomerase-like protein